MVIWKVTLHFHFLISHSYFKPLWLASKHLWLCWHIFNITSGISSVFDILSVVPVLLLFFCDFQKASLFCPNLPLWTFRPHRLCLIPCFFLKDFDLSENSVSLPRRDYIYILQGFKQVLALVRILLRPSSAISNSFSVFFSYFLPNVSLCKVLVTAVI